MPVAGGFVERLGWPEVIVILVITLVIVGTHEWRNVIKIFKDEEKEKKPDMHTEE